MPRVEVTVSCPVHASFRVQQVAGMFDVPLAERASRTFAVEVPGADEPWQIGLIVGPSGSGKTTIARQVFGDLLRERCEWPPDRAVIDCFGNLPAKQITGLLTAVGFGSPPAWIRPYGVLSRGEQFRCDLARALAGALVETPKNSGAGDKVQALPLVAFDEYTSVVDRTVAQIGSAAIARSIRGGQLPCRLVAVTCHYDVAEWLEPDWVVDMATSTLSRRCLRRPPVDLEIHRTSVAAWGLFARHHYLTGSLAPQAECYLTTWEGEPVNFCATLPMIGHRNRRRFTRVVTLPDYQGIGIGTRAMRTVAELHAERGHRVNITSSHPGLVQHCRRSPWWRAVGVRTFSRTATRSRRFRSYRDSGYRPVASFEFVPPASHAEALQ